MRILLFMSLLLCACGAAQPSTVDLGPCGDVCEAPDATGVCRKIAGCVEPQ